MVRRMLNYETTKNCLEKTLPTWLKEYPITLTQFFFYLYHNVDDFKPVFMTTEVLTALVGSLFPSIMGSGASEGGSSPVIASRISPAKEGHKIASVAGDGDEDNKQWW